MGSLLRAAREGDKCNCQQHAESFILPAKKDKDHPKDRNVLINKRRAACEGDELKCGGTIVKGADNILVCGRPPARESDLISHGGAVGVVISSVIMGKFRPIKPIDSDDDRKLIEKCIKKRLCKQDPGLLEKARQVTVVIRDPKHIFDSKGHMHTSGGTEDSGVVQIARNTPCDEVLRDFKHEMLHAEEPERWPHWKQEMNAYIETAKWAHSHGIDDPFWKDGGVDVDAVKKHVEDGGYPDIPKGSIPDSAIADWKANHGAWSPDPTDTPLRQLRAGTPTPGGLNERTVPPDMLKCNKTP